MAELGKDQKEGLLESPQVQNYLRLQYLLGVTTTTYLREQFYKNWKAFPSTSSHWENLPENGKQFVQSVGQKLYKDAMQIQKKYLASGNVNLWDLPLLVDALKCFHRTEEQKKSASRSFEKLKQVRNQQAHLGSIEMDAELFNRLWQDASNALLSLGLAQDILEGAKRVKLQTEQPPNPEDKINQENQNKANDLKDEGNLYFKKKNFQQAIRLYSQAILIPNLPNNYLAVLYSNRSISYLNSGDLQNAKEDAKGTIHLCPTWWKGYYRLASVYQKLQKFPKALKYNEISLGLSSSNAVEVIIDARDFCRHMIAKLKRTEHTDPLSFSDTFKELDERSKMPGFFKNLQEMEAAQKLTYELGLPQAICAQGLKYSNGIGVPQNYEMAAKLFAKAASKGNAEGMYNLSLLTKEGKGVRRNVAKATKLLFAAAEQDPTVEIIPGSGIKGPNLGVPEAQHALGLAYENGTGVPQDTKEAIAWYTKAFQNDSVYSANNLGLMYFNGKGVARDIRTAFDFWKVAALKGNVRAMENLAHNYITFIGDLTLARKWYAVGVQNGSIDLPLNKDLFKFPLILEEGFDTKGFLEGVKEEMMKGPFREYLMPKKHDLESLCKRLKETKLPGTSSSLCNPLSDEYKKEIILTHRSDFKEMKKKGAKGVFIGTQGAKLQPKPVADLFGLKPIFLKEMDQKNDHIYEGSGIKLTIIEDALVGEGRKSVGLIATDEIGDVQRVYVYNYPQNKETQEALGFGSRVTVVNPYFRVTADGKRAIRIDDPSLLFIHTNLKDLNQCRFCGMEKGTVACRKCRRVYYCSKLCFKKDAEELSHELVCVKRL